MKALRFSVIIMVLCFVISGFSFAEDTDKEKDAMMAGPMMGDPMMHGGPGGFPMMGMMPVGDMVATADGGVVILIGNRLVKYDSNLRLVKEMKIEVGKKR